MKFLLKIIIVLYNDLCCWMFFYLLEVYYLKVMIKKYWYKVYFCYFYVYFNKGYMLVKDFLWVDNFLCVDNFKSENFY